jgi:oligopeptide/dipeptide ABC transporter ATP-binding protein
MSAGARREEIMQLLERVGLDPAERFVDKFPHQLSGGQRQRVAIARAIALRPRLLIADEPVSSLDVSVAGQILNLLRRVQAEMGSSLLLVSHDLGLVRPMCARVVVIHRGRIVEEGRADDVLQQPAHPYTQQLVASMPERLRTIGLELIPAAVGQDLGEGCLYRGRCPYVMPRCTQVPPLLTSGGSHVARCWLLDKEEERRSFKGGSVSHGEN